MKKSEYKKENKLLKKELTAIIVFCDEMKRKIDKLMQEISEHVEKIDPKLNECSDIADKLDDLAIRLENEEYIHEEFEDSYNMKVTKK